MLLCAALACALAPGLAAQTNSGDNGFRTLYRYERKNPETLPASPKPLNTARAVFSDTSKPGTLKITDPGYRLEIDGAAGGEVLASSTLALKNSGSAGTGSCFELIEADNVITLGISTDGDSRLLRRTFKIQVPRDTSIVIEDKSRAADPGRSLAVSDVTGDVDINLRDGNVALKNTTGAITVTIGYGMIGAEFAEAPRKPIILSGWKGIDLTLPASAAANVGMDASMGCIRTDFPEDALKITPAIASFEGMAFSQVAKAEIMIRGSLLFKNETADSARPAPASKAAGNDSPRTRNAGNNQDLSGDESARIDALKARIAKLRQTHASDDNAPPDNERLEAIRTEIAKRRLERENDTTPSARPASRVGAGRILGELNGGGTDIYLYALSGTITLKQAK